MIGMKNKKVENSREKILRDFRIGFLASLITLEGAFWADFLRESFHWKYYYVVALILPVILFLLVERYIKKI